MTRIQLTPRLATRLALILALATLPLPSAHAQCPPDTLLATLDNPAPSGGDQFGSSVAVSGDIIVVGTRSDDAGGVLDAGTAWVFDAMTGALTATLNNPASAYRDEFGSSVAVSGDIAVVGAPRDDPGGVLNAGTAYVFDATNGALIVTLDNPEPGLDDLFGIRVAVSGSTAVVGAIGDASGGVIDAGRAFVFNATTGTLIATLNNPAPTNDNQFSVSVAVSGNIAVVGANWEDPGGVVNAGTAYVFDATTGALTATLSNPDPTANDYFGSSVAVSGNLVVVGAPYDDPGGVSGAGTAYVFDASTGALTATLNNPAPGESDRFGDSVAVSGDVAVVGASQDDPGGPGLFPPGAAYVFDATTGTLAATLTNPAPAWDDSFGGSVAVSGSLAVVGAPNDDPGGLNNAGSAYVFNCGDLIPTPTATPVPIPCMIVPNTATADRLPPLLGTIVSGTYADTFVSDNVRQTLAEQTGATGGLSHIWEFNLPAEPGMKHILRVEAFRSGGDGEAFMLMASLGDHTGPWQAFAQITAGTDTDEIPAFETPLTGGMSFIRVTDANPFFGDANEDRVHVDFLEMVSLGYVCDPTPTPSPAASASPTPAMPSPTPAEPSPTPTAPSASPTPVCCPGDADNSGGAVNANDFLAVQASFGLNNGTGGIGDADCSGGAVNAQDFLAVQAAFGSDCG